MTKSLHNIPEQIMKMMSSMWADNNIPGYMNQLTQCGLSSEDTVLMQNIIWVFMKINQEDKMLGFSYRNSSLTENFSYS